MKNKLSKLLLTDNDKPPSTTRIFLISSNILEVTLSKFVVRRVKFRSDNRYLSGAKKNKLAQAIFSNDGPNLNNPMLQAILNLQNKYKATKRNNGKPRLKTETPNRGIAIKWNQTD